MDSEQRIELLRGDPKKSVLRLSAPVMVTMVVTSLYSVVDGIWVAGLGQTAIAGIGLITPLFMVINGLSNGLGHGATSAVGRYAATDKAKAETAAEHSIMVVLTISALLTVLLLAILIPYLQLFDIHDQTAHEAIAYALPLFGGLVTFILTGCLAALMRAEGDTKRPMWACTIGIILNGALDPVFIYTLGWGSAGASFSTIFTSAISAAMLLYWMLVKRDTWLSIHLRGIFRRRYDMSIVRDILRTGIPASFGMLMMSLATTFFYSFIRTVGGDHGVSVYASGYRLYLLNLMPVTSISLASVTIVAAHFGKKNMEYVRRTHRYCCRYATLIGIGFTLLVVLFAHPLAMLFALTGGTPELVAGVARFIRITAFCIPFLGFGLPSNFVFLGMGKGNASLWWTTVQEVICAVPATWLLGIVMGYGLDGIWMGFVVGRGFASICNYAYTQYYLSPQAP